MVIIENNAEVILIGKAILITILGIFLGFISKHIIRKTVDTVVLKRFKEPHIHDVTSLINKIFAEAVQWIIIIGFFNYSISMLGFNFLSHGLEYIISNIPLIAGFILIVLVGIFVSKIIAARIREQDIENKNEIITLTELVIMVAFFLSALEFAGVKATALTLLFGAILLFIIIIVTLLIINPKLFERNKNNKPKKSEK